MMKQTLPLFLLLAATACSSGSGIAEDRPGTSVACVTYLARGTAEEAATRAGVQKLLLPISGTRTFSWSITVPKSARGLVEVSAVPDSGFGSSASGIVPKQQRECYYVRLKGDPATNMAIELDYSQTTTVETTTDRVIVAITRVDAPLDAVSAVLSFFGPAVSAQTLAEMRTTPVEKEVLHSALEVAARVPGAAQEIMALAQVTAALVTDAIDTLWGNTDFPEGASENAFTILPETPDTQTAGDWLVITAVYAGDIPLADASKFYQYGFVFDVDGNAANNFVPLPEFGNDYFQGSDRWYAAEYNPTSGWTLKVSSIVNNAPVSVASAARLMIKDNTIVLAIPTSEVPSKDAFVRTSSFCHDGDFGLNAPNVWSGDAFPQPGGTNNTVAPGQDGTTTPEVPAEGSAEAKAEDGTWTVASTSEQWCIRIENGVIVELDIDCDGVDPIVRSVPGQVTDNVLFWLVESGGNEYTFSIDQDPQSFNPRSVVRREVGAEFGQFSFVIWTAGG